ncbi:MAG: YggS family pyridoxal phosphate-dependent enzyme [Pseudomonadota bacterium]
MSDTAESTIAQRRAVLLADLARVAKRPPALIAVSKRQPDVRIEAALNAGQRVFGENQVQEAQTRWRERRAVFPDLELHLVGALQSNKAQAAVDLFDVIHSFDRPKLIGALVKAMEKSGRQPRILAQVNIAEEPQKAGVKPSDLKPLLQQAADQGLKIDGLMCIPPAAEPAAPYFALLAKLSRQQGLTTLSMGMSDDYAVAARLGATLVRVGTGFFGPRPHSSLT